MQFIASTTLATDTSALFSNIPQNFTHLQLRCFARSSRSGFADEWMVIRFNGDSGNNYSAHLLWGTGAVNNAAYSSVNYTFGTLIPPNSVNANMWGVSIFDILDYSNTNKNKVIRGLGGYDVNDTASINNVAMLSSGSYYSTSAISSISIVGNASIKTGSRFDLYGITASEVTGV